MGPFDLRASSSAQKARLRMTNTVEAISNKKSSTRRAGGMQEAQEKLGKRIRGHREKKGFSQESFADLCELNRVHMGDVERGNVNLTITTLDKIARNLKTTSSALLKGIL